MFRVGCRPLQRKYFKCKLENQNEDFSKCSRLEQELKDCYDTLYTFYFNMKKEDVYKNKLN
jgi:hypothetical protein